MFTNAVLAAALAWGLSGCDQVRMGPAPAASAPAEPAPPPPDVRPFAGRTYFALAGEVSEYSPAGLSMSHADQARFDTAMAVAAPAWIMAGGGAEALVMTGCAEAGCNEGRAVVAIDVATGAAFVGVRDGEGRTEFTPNPRLEALLRLSSPTRTWDSVEAPLQAAPAP